MPIEVTAYKRLVDELHAAHAVLVAVSKTKPAADVEALYALGQRDFGENYVQELVAKQALLPAAIRWHFIGHLQSNKIKMIAPFVHLIHGVDSLRLLEAIDKEGRKIGRRINCLLQVHIAQEDTKYGFDGTEVIDAASFVFSENKFPNVQLCGLMGMASFTENSAQVKKEFEALRSCFDTIRMRFPNQPFNMLSMGMSGDYKIALECGSNMIRIGSMLFGVRS